MLHFERGDIKKPLTCTTKALEIDPHNKSTNSKLYCNRATVGSKLHKLDQAIADCSKAVELDDHLHQGLLTTSEMLHGHQNSMRKQFEDYDQVNKLHRTRGIVFASGSSDDEIKKAYKKRALIHHPDRHAHATKEIQKEEEKKSVLATTTGHDLEDMGNDGFADVDPNQIFQAFFGGGMHGFFFWRTAGCWGQRISWRWLQLPVG
ncbi:hypothetical protein BaRGS_00030982 [Batillaria attramentaria]|uniref:J domain-containing protein n=1 Tax=Batillaria attramentaria TaxID=370345 RepID=A0ABD0JS29_9CAEN